MDVLTDHQPLLGAARNVLTRDNLRLDRLFDQIIGYDLWWTYVLGKANYLPDYLLRLPPQSIRPTAVDYVDNAVQSPPRGPVYDAIVAASAQDQVTDFVTQCVATGWPQARVAFPRHVRFLANFCHTLRLVDGVIADTNGQVYVPTGARLTVL